MKLKVSNVPLGMKCSIAAKQMLSHSAHSWENLWEKAPLLRFSCPLFFQKCLRGVLKACLLTPFHTRPFLEQAPNCLSSMVLTKKNVCVHPSAFVAASYREMRLFQSCFFVSLSLIQDMLSKLLLIPAMLAEVIEGHSSIFFKVTRQYLLVNSSETVQCGDCKSLLLQGYGLKSRDNVQGLVLLVLFSTLAKWGDGCSLSPTKNTLLFLRLKKWTISASAYRINYSLCFYQWFTWIN